MSPTLSREKEFLDRLTEITEAKLSNEQFGVNELAEEAGMSRSNLHRRVKSATGVSISRFISQVRLKRALTLLQSTSSSISEIAFDCGFHSVSYFTKCFHDHFGYSPGKVRSEEFEGSGAEDLQLDKLPVSTGKKRGTIIAAVSAVMIIVAASFVLLILKPFADRSPDLEKSIAVLPFRNDSPDEEKMYFINSIQAAIIDNLCNIEDLRVIERRSVEQYRNNPKPLAIIAKEMNVSYILDGNGFKDEDHIRLSIRLIDAKNEERLWSSSFDRKANETFATVSEIPQLVAKEINVVITPEEKERIEKIPTTSLTAYDFYQRGNERLFDFWNSGDTVALLEAEYLCNKALEYDSTFAAVYAKLAAIYGSKYFGSGKGRYEDLVNNSMEIADKALAIDDQCAEAYSHKGYCLVQLGKYELAVEELLKGIKYNPNYYETYLNLGHAYNNLGKQDLALANYYQASLLHRGKMLPYIYLQIGDFYRNFGFENKAGENYQAYLQLSGDSLVYFHYMGWLTFFNGDNTESISFTEKAIAMDPGHPWLLYKLAMAYMFDHQFKKSLEYFLDLEKIWKGGRLWNINLHRIAWVYWNLGQEEKANEYFNELIEVNNMLIEKQEADAGDYYNLATVLAFTGAKAEAMGHLKTFNQKARTDVRYNSLDYMLNLFKNDPLMDSIREDQVFRHIVSDLETRYLAEHEEIRNWLDEHSLL